MLTWKGKICVNGASILTGGCGLIGQQIWTHCEKDGGKYDSDL